jgi:hypothetical protein
MGFFTQKRKFSKFHCYKKICSENERKIKIARTDFLLNINYRVIYRVTLQFFIAQGPGSDAIN